MPNMKSNQKRHVNSQPIQFLWSNLSSIEFIHSSRVCVDGSLLWSIICWFVMKAVFTTPMISPRRAYS